MALESQNSIEDEACVMPAEFVVWKTIKLGTGLTGVDAFRNALMVANCRIEDFANDIISMSTFTVASEEVEVDLVKKTVSELGFNGAKYEDICGLGIALGLQLCPAEVGPQLRLQYIDQPLTDEVVCIAMEAITIPSISANGDRSIFSIGYGGGNRDEMYLFSSCGDPDQLYRPEIVFIFVLPRK